VRRAGRRARGGCDDGRLMYARVPRTVAPRHPTGGLDARQVSGTWWPGVVRAVVWAFAGPGGLSFFGVGAEVGACVAEFWGSASLRGWNGSLCRVCCVSVAIPRCLRGLMRASVGRCRNGCGAGLTLYGC